MKKMAIPYRNAKFLSVLFIILSVSWFVVSQISDSLLFVVTDAAWILLVSAFVLVQTHSFRMSENGKLVVLTGFSIRLSLVLYGIYGTGAPADLLRRWGDQPAFLRPALQYLQGDFTEYWTRYPYVIYGIFQLMGPERIMAQLVNILCWFLGVKVLLSVSDIHGQKKIRMLFLYAYLPNALLLSTLLLRESMISLFSMLVVLYLWRWMNTGHIRYMIIVLLASVPPILLHSGNIALLAGSFFVFCRWDCKMGKWRRLDWRCIIMVLWVFTAILLYENANVIAPYLEYLPREISWKAVTGRASMYMPARADYIALTMPNDLGEFIFWSIRQIFYFWVSPTPGYWTSPLDVIGFLFDSIPMAFCFWKIFENIKKDRRHSKSLAGLYILIPYTILYAWGTVNAGTAMRHRDQLLGIMVMSILIGWNPVMSPSMSRRSERWESNELLWSDPTT